MHNYYHLLQCISHIAGHFFSTIYFLSVFFYFIVKFHYLSTIVVFISVRSSNRARIVYPAEFCAINQRLKIYLYNFTTSILIAAVRSPPSGWPLRDYQVSSCRRHTTHMRGPVYINNIIIYFVYTVIIWYPMYIMHTRW